MEYKILEAMRREDLENIVARALSEGFVPTGGVCYAGQRFFQAVVKNGLACTECGVPATTVFSNMALCSRCAQEG